MTKTCILCKKQSVFFNKSRSFHKFPNDSELKKKWIEAIGNCKVTKTSTICSDHFEVSSFHESNGYNYIKRLLPNAIPKVIPPVLVDVTNVKKNDPSTGIHWVKPQINITARDTLHANDTCDIPPTQEYKHDSKTPDIIVNLGGDTTSLSECHTNACNATNVVSAKESLHDLDTKTSNSSSNLKRKYTEDKDIVTTKKRFRYIDGERINFITREHFVSDEAWNGFLKFVTCHKKKLNTSTKRIRRQQQRIEKLKELVKTFKNEKLSTAVEYLEVILV